MLNVCIGLVASMLGKGMSLSWGILSMEIRGPPRLGVGEGIAISLSRLGIASSGLRDLMIGRDLSLFCV